MSGRPDAPFHAHPRRAAVVLGLLGILLTTSIASSLQAAPGVEQSGQVSGAMEDLADEMSVAAPIGARDGDTLTRTFEWRHQDRTWRLDVTVDEAFLAHYNDKERLHYSHDYVGYILDTDDDAWVAALAHELDDLYAAAGIDGTDRLDAILSFVQHLPYALDKETTPYSEWPRYPVETLFAEASDCEDTTILFISILRALDHDAILLSPPKHMAAGVALDDHEGVFEEHDGKRYYYAETTGKNWRIGKMPSRFDGDDLRVYHVDPQVLIARPTWTTQQDGETLKVEVSAQNLGDLDAHGVEIGARLSHLNGKTWHQNACTDVTVDAESVVTCSLTLKLPAGEAPMRIGAWIDSPDAPERTQSQMWPAP